MADTTWWRSGRWARGGFGVSDARDRPRGGWAKLEVGKHGLVVALSGYLSRTRERTSAAVGVVADTEILEARAEVGPVSVCLGAVVGAGQKVTEGPRSLLVGVENRYLHWCLWADPYGTDPTWRRGLVSLESLLERVRNLGHEETVREAFPFVFKVPQGWGDGAVVIVEEAVWFGIKALGVRQQALVRINGPLGYHMDLTTDLVRPEDVWPLVAEKIRFSFPCASEDFVLQLTDQPTSPPVSEPS
ncbi:MAG: hypothetical protein IT477_10590 [Rhodanobacteraceae bacterium]|nr:hypothetical protein [Rhodanobacteraceae bacterium]